MLKQKCKTCEQMRKSVALAWRSVTRRRCIVPGCTNRAVASLCEAHWRALPLSLRVQYWEESNYGRQRPSPQLLAEIIDKTSQH